MSINSVLGTARLALQAQQTAMETTSHNIANAQTVGYTRQRAILTPNTPLYTEQGAIGRGVLVSNVERTRNGLLDTNYRYQSSQSNGADTKGQLLSDISNVYSEPSDSAFATTLDQFWDAWGDLVNNPNDTASKSVVQQRGSQLANTLNRYARGLSDIDVSTRTELQRSLDSLNGYSKQVGKLNEQIVAAEASGTTAGDLRDQRDILIDKMSAIAPTQTIENRDGSVNVYVANTTIVDGVVTRELQAGSSGGQIAIQVKGNSSFLSPTAIGGSLNAMLDVINTDIPAQRTQLDALAQQLVTQINTIHRTGWTAAGDALGGANWDSTAPPTGSNVNFFDPAGVTAASISLSANVKANSAFVAAGNVQNGTGNNAVATQMTQLRTADTSIQKYGSATQTVSFDDYYRDQITRLGVATNDAMASATVYSTLAQQADTYRQSANGVSTDEELIEMTKHQQAYAAAAKIITTADQMAQTLLDMIL
jgi:flagellar hook-associated protein 1